MKRFILTILAALLAGCLSDPVLPAPQVSIEPADPSPGEDFTLLVEELPSGEGVTELAVVIAWTVDGAVVAELAGVRTISGDTTEAGQVWTASVYFELAGEVGPAEEVSAVIGGGGDDDDDVVPDDDDDTPVDEDGDGSMSDEDCDDEDPANYPGNVELCDGQDNDCHEGADFVEDTVEGPVTEDDGDGDGVLMCDGDCDDSDAAIYPDAEEVCDGIDSDCNGAIEDVEDADSDGVTSCDGDCDDGDPASYPGADEVCDGADNDCDEILDGYEDEDGDGAFACVNDCDDDDPDISPWEPEVCDGVDNNCTDGVDDGFDQDGDGVTTCGPDGVAGNLDDDCDDGADWNFPGNSEICDEEDNDCDGAADEDFDLDGDGFFTCGVEEEDCDDADPAINPGATEVCDGIDNDCDGEIEDVADFDVDGVTSCDGDCADDDPARFPGNTEVCDGQDNDCDGSTEFQGPLGGETDGDGDGVWLCGNDCDDNEPSSFPGNAEICDGLDNDCNGALDFDVDGDGVGDQVEDDDDGDGVFICDSDCDDADPANFPGNTEVCDGLDNNCDAVIDDGFDGDGDGTTTCGPDGITGNIDDDCDDTDPSTSPSSPELCDEVDNDCDGALPTDELDGDGDGWIECDGDCDDGEPLTFPNAIEVCDDGSDSDCDGQDGTPGVEECMVEVPAGTFWMGCAPGDSQCNSNESPYHEVYLDAVLVDATEVTVAAYGECASTGLCGPLSSSGRCNGPTEGDTNPANCVSWADADTYCTWAGKRLPTEAEWEKAARGTDERLYPWGDVTPDCTLAVIRSPGGLRGCDLDLTWPVGSMPAGASPYGALDMAGNVGEWVADWFSSTYYSDPSATSNPTGPATGGQRVNRGGTFEVNGGLLRCSARGYATPAGGYSAVGFRCAATP